MRIKLFFAIVVVLFTATLTSCNNDDDVTLDSEYADVLDNHGNPFPFDENERPYGYGGISEENFNNHIAGRGWKCKGTWKINDNGRRCKTNYYTDMLGVSPTHYYFASNGMGKAYTISDLEGKGPCMSYRLKWSFKYDKSSNETSRIVFSDYGGFMQVIGWSQGVLCVIEPLYSDGSGKETYAVALYKEMSDDELTQYNKTYTEILLSAKH